jgi:glycosyltransferase involved in cell wall biosynthesis
MQKKNEVLIIAYFFPPIGGSGALRPFKLAKYLSDFGWNPVILTVRNPDWYYARDADLLEELPPQIRIIRTFMIRSAWLYRLLNPFRSRKIDKTLSRFIIQPDDQIGWIPFGYFKGLDFIRRNCIKAIYSTSSPLSCHIIAYLIHKKTGLPWIADFRDEWYENPDFDFPKIFYRRFHYNLEKKIVKAASKVIAPAPEFCRLLAKHCDDSSKFVTVSMGFDPEDFSGHAISKSNKEEKFILVFSGLFYSSFRPSKLLKALDELINEGKISPDRIKVRFVGANTPGEADFKDEYGICEFTGFVSHKNAIRHVLGADALLLLLSEDRGKNVVPSKTFEYMASGKPILAVVPKEGEIARIIQKTETGLVVDFKDTEGIKRAYLKLYQQWEDKKLHKKANKEELSKYNQKFLTKRFARLLDEITSMQGHSPT